MTEIPADEKFDFKRALPIFVIVLVDLMGLTIVIPLLHLYATSFGADALTIGLVATAYPLMQFIGGPILGSLSDKFGRKPVLLVSQIGTFIGFIVLGFANSLMLILLARVIDGISGANIAAAQAALSDITTEKTRTQGLGLIGAAFGLGFILGPIIAFIALGLSGNNYAVPAFIAAGFSLVSILLTAFWFKETHPAEKRGANSGDPDAKLNLVARINKAVKNPLVSALLVLMFAQQLVFFGFENLLGLFTLNRLGMNGQGNTILFIFVGILIVMVQGKWIGPWSRKYGERKLILGGLMILGFGLILISITPRQPMPGYSQEALIIELTSNSTSGETASADEVAVDLPSDESTGWLGIAWLMVAMIPTAIGGGVLHPSINSLITRRVTPTQVGSILGVSASFVSAANAITPTIGGALFEQFGSTVPFMSGGVVLIILFFLSMWKLLPSAPQDKPVVTDAKLAADT